MHPSFDVQHVLTTFKFLETFGHPSADTQGTMTSVYNIGCFIGALSTIITGDILGRPRQILLGSSVIAIGAIIQTACWSVPQMYVGRVVAGLGTGMNTATAGVWQAEVSRMTVRQHVMNIELNNFTDQQDALTRQARHYSDGQLYVEALGSSVLSTPCVVAPCGLTGSRHDLIASLKRC